MDERAFAILASVVGVALLVVVLVLYQRLRQARKRLSTITDADAESQRIRGAAQRDAESITKGAQQKLDELNSSILNATRRTEDAMRQAADAERRHSQVKQELSQLEENLEDISFGIYKPHFKFDTPEKFKVAIERVVDRQRDLVRTGRAASSATQWEVHGSRKEGERMQKQYSKLMLRAFNGECDAAIAKVTWNNAVKMEERIRKAFEAINALGGVMTVTIAREYMELKLEELQLEYEFEESKRLAAEEQRRIREQMREEEKAQRELEAAQAKAEDEEERSAKALDKARVEMAKAMGAEHERLTARVLALEAELVSAQQKKAKLKAMAELTKVGYVYFISNIGSFGEGVFKRLFRNLCGYGMRDKRAGSALTPPHYG